MGTGTLPVAVDDNIIPATHHNALVEAMLLDIVPRNASRVATSDAGQIGSSLYRFLRGFFGEVRIGTSAENLKVYSGAANEMWIEIPNGDRIQLAQGDISIWTDGVKRFSIQDGGIDWSIINDFTILSSKLANRFVAQSNLVSGSVSGTTGIPVAGTFSPSLKAGRQYVLSISIDSVVAGIPPADLWIHESNTAGFIKNWGTTSGTSIRTTDDVIFTGLIDGVHVFQWWCRRLDFVEAQITIKEF